MADTALVLSSSVGIFVAGPGWVVSQADRRSGHDMDYDGDWFYRRLDAVVCRTLAVPLPRHPPEYRSSFLSEGWLPGCRDAGITPCPARSAGAGLFVHVRVHYRGTGRGQET